MIIVKYECSVVVFFFKQKTAYEMLRGLVGSEMCIRDRQRRALASRMFEGVVEIVEVGVDGGAPVERAQEPPVSYTHLTLPTTYSV